MSDSSTITAEVPDTGCQLSVYMVRNLLSKDTIGIRPLFNRGKGIRNKSEEIEKRKNGKGLVGDKLSGRPKKH